MQKKEINFYRQKINSRDFNIFDLIKTKKLPI